MRDELYRELGEAIVISPVIYGHMVISPTYEGGLGSYLTANEIDRLTAIVSRYGFSLERKVIGGGSTTLDIYELYVVHPARKLDVLWAEYQQSKGRVGTRCVEN